jgi:hypothetical protein
MVLRLGEEMAVELVKEMRFRLADKGNKVRGGEWLS